MEYTQLDKTEQLNKVQTRIGDIERQYFDLSLRAQAPDLTVPPNEMDKRNLATLEASLETLHAMESDLSS